MCRSDGYGVWDRVESFDAQSRTGSQNQADLGLSLRFSGSQRHTPTQRFTEYPPGLYSCNIC